MTPPRAVVEVGVFCAVLAACALLVVRARRGARAGSADRESTAADDETGAPDARRPSADGGYPLPEYREVDLSPGYVRALVVRALTTTDHRDIGLLYVVFGTVAALWGGIDAMMMRLELLTPVADVWSEATYNALFTTHGLTMLIFFVTPVFFGIGNYLVPLLIGADDMAFPRLNAVGFWLLPPSLLLARAGLLFQVTGQVLGTVLPPEAVRLFATVEEPGVGWTLYTPLSTTTANPQIDLLLLGLHLSGIATTVGAINFIVTVAYERADGVGWANLDLFSWNMLTTSGLALFAFPLLGSAIVMLLLDRNFGTVFYAVEGGGPVLWQHLFWFWGHPEVYILFLPAAGLLSTILPKFVGRKLFGYRFVVYSTLGIAVMSFGVWAHHMFVSNVDPRVKASFMAVSVAIAVPSAIKTFNWITTIWDGRVRVTAPLVLCIGAVGTFVVGGVTGVFLAAIPVDVVYHGTYYVVAHFHFIVMGIIPYAMMAASYYWFPLLTGRMYDRRLALFQSGLMVFGTTVTFGALLVVGYLEIPRRLATYPARIAPLQQVASLGAFVLGVGVLLWLYNVVWSAVAGDPVRDADVWDLKESRQFTREWGTFEDRLEREHGIEPTEPETTRPAATTDPSLGTPSVFRGEASVAGSVARDAVRAAVAGAVATALMSTVLLAGVLVGVLAPASFADLASLAGLGRSVPLGYVVFFLGGTTTWPLLFAALSEYVPGRLRITSGFVFASIAATGFLVAFYTGQAGLRLVGYLGVVFTAHWLYGAVLAVLLEYFERARRAAL